MNYEFPLTFFTVLTQAAVGISLFAAYKACCGTSEHTPPAKTDWILAFLLAVAGLIASIFHLGKPMGAPTALNHLGVAWLSREILAFSLFTGAVFLCMFVKGKALPLIAAACGAVGVAVQGMTYAPVSMPAIHNGFPMLYFALTALVLGAAFARLSSAPEAFASTLRTSSVTLLAVLLIVPCVWASGGTVMRMTAEAWLGSLPFWGCMLSLAIGAFAARCGKARLMLCVVLTVGAILGRMAFFSATVHSAVNMGAPY